MSKNVLLWGRTPIRLDEFSGAIGMDDVALFSGTSLDDVEEVFGRRHIQSVIMGAGIDLETRLQIVNHIFESGDSTTVHLMLPFVTSILRGFDG